MKSSRKVKVMDFEQYLRDNPMPTKSVDNDSYRIVECRYEFVRKDELWKHFVD